MAAEIEQNQIIPCVLNPQRDCPSECPAYNALKDFIGGQAIDKDQSELSIVESLRASEDRLLSDDLQDLKFRLKKWNYPCLYSQSESTQE